MLNWQVALTQAYASAQRSLILQAVNLGLVEPSCLQALAVVAALKHAMPILLVQKQFAGLPSFGSGLDMPDGALPPWP